MHGIIKILPVFRYAIGIKSSRKMLIPVISTRIDDLLDRLESVYKSLVETFIKAIRLRVVST